MDNLTYAGSDVLNAYGLNFQRFGCDTLDEVYDKLILVEGQEKPDRAEFLTVLETQYNKYLLKDLRKKRNKMLSETDWIVNSDVVLAEEVKNKWIEYRQQLRDLTSNVQLKYGVDMDSLFPDIPYGDAIITSVIIPVKQEVRQVAAE